MKNYIFILLVLVLVSIACGGNEIANTYSHQVVNTRSRKIDGSGSLVLSGEVHLPAEGVWQIGKESGPDEGIQLYLPVPKSVGVQFTGTRMAHIQKEKLIEQGRNSIWHSIATASMDYAAKHDGIGPTSLSDIDSKKYSHAIAAFSESPWDDEEYKDIEGPFVFMIPAVKFNFKENANYINPEQRELLAFELRPFVDDGKHWVVYTDNSCERKEIDVELVKKYNLTIRPVLSKKDEMLAELPKELPKEFTYRLIAVCPKGAKNKISVRLYNQITEQELTAEWNISSAIPGDESLLKDLKKARQEIWWPYLRTSSSGVIPVWLTSTEENPKRANVRTGRGARTSVLNVMGGRAAIRETLQMQILNPTGGEQERTIPVGTVRGVTVKSHPYEKMLEGTRGGEIALANVIPPDHFFVYAAKPEAVLPMSEDGADFLSNLGGSIMGSSIKYYLKLRYLKRLGLDEKWLSMFLKSGAIKECGIVAPDMFFIDGTEITIVSRLTAPKLIAPLLKIAGVSGLSDGRMVKTTDKNGKPVFWAMRSDLLAISTGRSELDLVLGLIDAEGRGSLGASAEFRYMLTQLPVNERTRVYAYFSDPFIRRLVGPATKIAQLRRVIAKGKMEHITAAALLARLDGIEKPSSIELLVKLGYLPHQYSNKGYSLNSELVVSSTEYGTLSNLATVNEVAVDTISREESDTYKAYVENYTRFWRQFFDPIAIRLDDAKDGSLEATTFILPLIDSSIYNGLKEALMSHEDGVALKTPRFSPDPVLKLSLNLKDNTWQKIANGMIEMVTRYVGVSPALMDDLGPAVHLAIHDADPVIAMGSGDIMGVFGGDMTRLGRGTTMMFIPIAMSMLTRPCTLAVEIKNPQKTLGYLRHATTNAPNGRARDEMNVQFYKIKARDSWVYSMDIMGAIKIRFGIEVRDGFLMLRNIPWSGKGHIASVDNSALNGACLEVYPAACKLQLPGLHAAESEHQALASLNGASLLYPLLASRYASIDNAAKAHGKLFGFEPVHPDGGQWLWDNQQLTSTSYGSPRQIEQPLYVEGDTNFGLMKKIERLSIRMQFEHTGLRTKIKWKTR